MLSRAPLGSTSGTARPVSRLIRRTSARIGSCGSVTVATRPSVGASGRRPPPSCCPQSATWTSRPDSGRERSVIARWEQGAVAPSLEAPPESLRPRRPRGAVRRRGTARESRHARRCGCVSCDRGRQSGHLARKPVSIATARRSCDLSAQNLAGEVAQRSCTA